MDIGCWAQEGSRVHRAAEVAEILAWWQVPPLQAPQVHCSGTFSPPHTLQPMVRTSLAWPLYETGCFTSWDFRLAVLMLTAALPRPPHSRIATHYCLIWFFDADLWLSHPYNFSVFFPSGCLMHSQIMYLCLLISDSAGCFSPITFLT